MNREFTQMDFEDLKKGDEKAFDKLYMTNYSYVIGMLKYKYNADKTDADDYYADAVLRFREIIGEREIVFTNIRGYILKTALNFLREQKRRDKSLVKKVENYLIVQEQLQEEEVIKEDNFLLQEGQDIFYDNNTKKIHALKLAFEKLGDICKELLLDTIVRGLKPRDVFEKFDYKNTRVITDKKGKCKKKLLKLTEQIISEMR